VVGLVNSSGTVVERYAYDAFGAVTVMNGSWTVGSTAYAWTVLYQGMTFDSTTGLYGSTRVRGSGYSPTLGRWGSLDPTGYGAGDNNLYGFVGENPVNRLDPTGLIGVFFGGTDEREIDETRTIRILQGDYSAVNGPSKFFEVPGLLWGGPGLLPGGWRVPGQLFVSLKPIVNEAADFVMKNLPHGGVKLPGTWGQGRYVPQPGFSMDRRFRCLPSEYRIDIFGYSRGAAAAVELAFELKKRGVDHVNFIGLIDAVGSGAYAFPISLIIPSIVHGRFHAVKDPPYELLFGPGVLYTMTIGGVTPTKFKGLKHVKMGSDSDVRDALMGAAKANGVVWSERK
jgi:RHS repeat-associated protein